MLEGNKQLFNMIFDNYELILTEFEENLTSYLQDESLLMNFRSKNLMSVFFFNRVFVEMFDHFQNKRSKYELKIAFTI